MADSSNQLSGPVARRKPCLDQISLDLMIAGTKAAGVRRTRANVQACAGLQIAIREALRAVLPPKDPRKDPDYVPNHDRGSKR